MPPPLFDHEKLRVYRHAISFVVWREDVLARLPKTLSVRDQLDRASMSIPLHIAEGNGKFSAPDRCRFFASARGSALECAACLEMLVAERRLTASEVIAGKALLADLVSMLVGLSKNNSECCVFEDEPMSGATV